MRRLVLLSEQEASGTSLALGPWAERHRVRWATVGRAPEPGRARLKARVLVGAWAQAQGLTLAAELEMFQNQPVLATTTPSLKPAACGEVLSLSSVAQVDDFFAGVNFGGLEDRLEILLLQFEDDQLF